MDAQKLGEKTSQPLDTKIAEEKKPNATKAEASTKDDLLRYSYSANDSLNASDFVLPTERPDSTTSNTCDYTLSDKDFKAIKKQAQNFSGPL